MNKEKVFIFMVSMFFCALLFVIVFQHQILQRFLQQLCSHWGC